LKLINISVMKNKLFLFLFFLLTFYHILNAQQQTNIALKAKETLAAVELDKGDTLFYTTKNGYKHFLTVKEVSIEVVFSTLDDLEEKKRGAGVIYSMSCKVNIDGQEMTMKKYIPVQQSYYEPYIVNGMRIWYDGNAEAGEIF